jgi:hypothetical protein
MLRTEAALPVPRLSVSEGVPAEGRAPFPVSESSQCLDGGGADRGPFNYVEIFGLGRFTFDVKTGLKPSCDGSRRDTLLGYYSNSWPH